MREHADVLMTRDILVVFFELGRVHTIHRMATDFLRRVRQVDVWMHPNRSSSSAALQVIKN